MPKNIVVLGANTRKQNQLVLELNNQSALHIGGNYKFRLYTQVPHELNIDFILILIDYELSDALQNKAIGDMALNIVPRRIPARIVYLNKNSQPRHLNDGNQLCAQVRTLISQSDLEGILEAKEVEFSIRIFQRVHDVLTLHQNHIRTFEQGCELSNKLRQAAYEDDTCCLCFHDCQTDYNVTIKLTLVILDLTKDSTSLNTVINNAKQRDPSIPVMLIITNRDSLQRHPANNTVQLEGYKTAFPGCIFYIFESSPTDQEIRALYDEMSRLCQPQSSPLQVASQKVSSTWCSWFCCCFGSSEPDDAAALQLLSPGND